MKKLILSAIFILGCMVASNAQVKFGIKGGLNANTSDMKKMFSSGEIAAHDNPLGYHFGLMARIQVPVVGLYVQPELLYNSNTTRFNYNSTSITSTDNYFKVRKSNIDIPVLLGFKFLMFRINAGPVFQFNFNEKVKSIQDQFDVSSDVKNKYIGYQAGVGLDIMSLTFDIRYCGNFGKTSNNLTIAQKMSSAVSPAQQVRYNEGQVMFSLGYMF